MDNKIFTTVLILVIAVLVGLSLTSRQNNAPMLNGLTNSQQEMNAKLDKLMQDGGGDNGTLVARLNTLEARFNALEEKVNSGAVRAPARQAPPQPDLTKVHTIPVAHTPVVGVTDAKVTITEFVDLECPFCSRFHGPIEEALEAYPNDVNYLVKNFPLSFHPNAKPAAKAALAAAEQGKYREMINGLLDNGRNLNPATYEKLATDIGLDMAKFKSDLEKNDAQYEDWIRKDMTLASQVGVRGTPTFFINGRLTNARNFDALKREIEAILNGS